MADIGDSLVRAMRSLIDAEVHTVNWFGAIQVEDISTRSGEVPVVDALAILNAHLHEHPLLPMVGETRKDGVPRAMRWSDATTLRAFRQTGLFHDFFRPIGSNRQIALAARVAPGALVALTFNRNGRDFQSRDVAMLKMLAPHVSAAVETVRARAELQAALSLRELAGHDDAVVVASGGIILFATDVATEMLRRHFGRFGPPNLPRDLAAWLRRNPLANATFNHSSGDGRLTCTVGKALALHRSPLPWERSGRIAPAIRCLRLAEGDGQTAVSFQELGLTPRAAEVLHWIVQGKRDPEIAQILGCSVRTIHQHVGRILACLGVETRTAAAMEAVRRSQRNGGTP